MKKKLYCILLSLALVVTMMPMATMSAFADIEPGAGHNLIVMKGDAKATVDKDYKWEDNQLIILENGLTVTGTGESTSETICVDEKVSGLTISNVNIISSDDSPICFNDEGVLTLVGNNVLTNNKEDEEPFEKCVALLAYGDLTIAGSGSLIATSKIANALESYGGITTVSASGDLVFDGHFEGLMSSCGIRILGTVTSLKAFGNEDYGAITWDDDTMQVATGLTIKGSEDYKALSITSDAVVDSDGCYVAIGDVGGAVAKSVLITGASAVEDSGWSKLTAAMAGEGDYSTETTIKNGAKDLFKANDATEGGVTTRTITLLADIKAGANDSALVVPENKKVVLDLNGYVLDRGLITSEGKCTATIHGSVIETHGELTITDSNSGNQKHNFQAVGDDQIWVLDETNGKETVNGGVITGGTGYFDSPYSFGGGIYSDNGLLSVKGGNIIGNTAYTSSQPNGGGIFGNEVTIEGGSIKGNYAAGFGGAIASSSLTITGGEISNNTSFYGGGLYVCGNLLMTGGEISNNTAITGGGIALDAPEGEGRYVLAGGAIINNHVKNGAMDTACAGGIYTYGNITLGGKLVVDGNTNVTTDVSDDFHYNQGISVKLADGTDAFAPAPKSGFKVGLRTDANDESSLHILSAEPEQVKYFFSDNPEFYVVFNNNSTTGTTSDDYIELKKITGSEHTVNVGNIDNGAVYTDKQVATSGTDIHLTVVPDTGFVLKSLKYFTTNKESATDITESKSFSMPNANVSIMAEFEEASYWELLLDAMAGDNQATVPDVLRVSDDASTGVRTITLLADIKAGADDSTLTVPTGKNIVLDLNGHVLDRGLVAANGSVTEKTAGGVIENYGNLTITDSKPTETHKFRVLENGDNKGLWVLDEKNGTKTVKGGIITGGVTNTSGGGIYLDGGKLTMEGGTVAGNQSDASAFYKNGMGGGVFIYNNGEFIMNAGNIAGNVADLAGGGVTVYSGNFTLNAGNIIENIASDGTYGSGGGVFIGSGNFKMNGGSITGNVSQYGGGVDNNDGTFNMEDGLITGNTATYGAGIQNAGEMHLSAANGKSITIISNTATDAEGGVANWGEMHISGKVIIKDNICTQKYGEINYPINLATQSPIVIDGALSGSEIYLTHAFIDTDKHDEGVLTSGYTEKNSGAGLNEFFHYDGPTTFYMDLNTSGDNQGELEVKSVPAEKFAVSIPSIPNGKITADKQIAASEETVTLTVKPDSGYELDTLTVKDADNGDVTVTNNQFTMPSKAVTVSATFKESQKQEPSGGVTSQFSVKFDFQGQEVSDFEEPEVLPDGKIAKPQDPVVEGYTFGGWYKDKACTEAWDFDNDTAKEDTMLYAKWTKNEPKAKAVSVALLKAKASGSKAVKLSWNKVKGATKYVIYGAKCGYEPFKALKTVKGTSLTVKKIKGLKLKAHTPYKFYVVAYTANGKVKSKTIHFITANTQGKYANVKSIKAKTSKLTLKVGDSKKVGASYKMYKGKKHLLKKVHGQALRYISNNPGVVTVTKTGTVKAVGKGTATIYIQDIGGKYCKTTVTVK